MATRFVRDLTPRQHAAELTSSARVQDGLAAAGLVLQGEWKDVLSTPGQGDIYEAGTRFLTIGGRTFAIQDDEEGRPSDHRASAPGDPPAADFGNLRNSIDVEEEPGRVFVGSSSRVAAWLEYGVGTAEAVDGPHPGGIVIEPRPSAEPAYAAAKQDMTKAMLRALRGE